MADRLSVWRRSDEKIPNRQPPLVEKGSNPAIEIESITNPFALYFIHADGSWFFKGLGGYVV